jgi:Na+-transporting methylmalonyl-CoA/oxaloacetate decarboxylase gamma subunit
VVEQLVFIVQGFGLVMTVLALLWFVSALLGRIFATRERRPAPSPPSASAVGAAPAPAVSAGVPPAHVAAIAAAVAVATSGRGRVIRVVAPAHGAAGWVGSGRSHHAHGHRTRAGWNQAQLAAPRRSPSPAIAEDVHS